MKTKTWFITGASKGFGFQIAKAALANGDRVVAGKFGEIDHPISV